jgi:hypothetical protein
MAMPATMAPPAIVPAVMPTAALPAATAMPATVPPTPMPATVPPTAMPAATTVPSIAAPVLRGCWDSRHSKNCGQCDGRYFGNVHLQFLLEATSGFALRIVMRKPKALIIITLSKALLR